MLTLTKRGGVWHITGTVAGRRIRASTGTGERSLADAARIKLESELQHRAIHGAKGFTTFAEAAESYLASEARSPATASYVHRLLIHFGAATRLRDIDQVALDAAYRAILRPDALGATKIRAVLTPLRAIMQHAAVRRMCDMPAFEEPGTRDSDTRTTFLLPAQATALVHAATALEHRVLFTWLVATGTRAGEAFDLPWSDVDLRGARAKVFQKQGTWRQVNLPPVVVAALASLPHRDGFVFRPPPVLRGGVLVQAERYADTNRTSGGQAQTAFAGACHRAGLPGHWVAAKRRYWQPDLRVHDLRHTWASAHYAQNKDILRLMVDGGWAGPSQVQRYAHLMPEVYADEWRSWLAGGIAEARRTA